MIKIKGVFAALLLAKLLLGAATAVVAQSFNGDRDGHKMVDVVAKSDIPPAPVLSPEQAVKSFLLQPGFTIDVVANEPQVFSPVAIAFDAKGGIWVAEMTTYMPDVRGTGEMQAKGSIALLEDTDGDGKVDRRQVLLDNLLLPRTVSVVHGGIFYADHNSLYFAEVLRQDGNIRLGVHDKVDPSYAQSGSVEHKANGMLYNMDGWYYNAKSDQRYKTLSLQAEVPAGAEEIYRNRYWKLVRAATDYRGQWGITHDDYGRLYHNGNSSPIHGEYLLPGSLLRNPGFWPDMPAHSIGDNRVYPARMTPGVNRGYMDGVLISDGDNKGKLVNFTAASASVVYRGSNLPARFYGAGLTPEPAANLISARQIIEGHGELNGENLFDQQELLASTDERFRPVALANAPDGSVYIVDMYHGILQHKDFLTSYLAEQIKDRKLDENNNTMGRIYRLRWQERTLAPIANLLELSDKDLVPLLTHKNAWHRDTARRLLVQTQAVNTASDIRKLLMKSDPSDMAQAYAQTSLLWTLYGLNAVDLATVKRFIEAPSPQVAMTAAAVGEALPAKDHKAYKNLLLTLAKTGYPQALQAAISVAAVDGGHKVSRYVLDQYRQLPYVREAVISGLGAESKAFLASIDGQYPDQEIMDILAGLGKKRQDASNRENLTASGQAFYDAGKALYHGRAACAGCHGAHGKGVPGLGPTFWGSQWLANKEKLAKVLLHGLRGPIWVGQEYWNTAAVMPGFATREDMSDGDLAAIAVYIRNSWGNSVSPDSVFTAEDIANTRSATASRNTPYTEREL
ncbi:PVC-type heme-binding CxxCH protein [Gilvimarinus chinensis]|uniref:PVC-type heme-binding CxxCH protein n=1 Tax=Gilvimarinus chinensis TaxID=396005 RepID=UPI00037EC1EE|nr:PVC-type heme-binding CxxCH protein [Gilvimarinus chinensis]